MVSDNESEFTDPIVRLNQFDLSSRISSQNFLIIFQNFNFFNILITLKNKNSNVAWIKVLICMFS